MYIYEYTYIRVYIYTYIFMYGYIMCIMTIASVNYTGCIEHASKHHMCRMSSETLAMYQQQPTCNPEHQC